VTGSTAANGYLLPQYRTTTFFSEYGCNCIPVSRQSSAAMKMLAFFSHFDRGGTPSTTLLQAQLANDYNGTGTLSYNRNTSDSKITYNPSDRTSIFGRYSVEPFAVTDPQELGAPRRTFDGGQPALHQAASKTLDLEFRMSFHPIL